MFSILEADISLESLSDYLRIVDESVLLVDATPIAAAPLLRRDEIVGLSLPCFAA